MAPWHRIYPNVEIGPGAEIGDFVILGVPPRGAKPGELRTVIGPGAVIRSHTVIYAGTVIGARLATGHGALIRQDNAIGDDVSIGSHAVVEYRIRIGHRVRIHSQAFVCEFSVLEDDSWIGPNVVLTNVPHPMCPKAKECIKGPTIGSHAKLGANTVVLPAVSVGPWALIGAGSVVVDDVPEAAVVAGNPGRVIKSIDKLTCPYELVETPYAAYRELTRMMHDPSR
jgi:acetyltransferase-like isoleucine patch superfamily enzyme